MNPGFFVRDLHVCGRALFRSSGLASINIEAVPDSTSPSRFGDTVVFALRSGRVTIGHELHTACGVGFDGAQIYIGTDSTFSVKLTGPGQANPAKRRLVNAFLE